MISLKLSNKKEPFYDVEIDENGTILYHNKNGQLHNLIGPAIEGSTGYKAYFINDKKHRLNGPAVIFSNGSKAYYVNNKLHRTDGPAIDFSNGRKEYWINGKRLTKEKFDKLTRKNNND